jgi:HPt (histidine-containing phosphotransfer) domain-containing protein
MAHTLKGMAGNLIAPRLLELSRDTEAAGREGSADLGRMSVSLADAMAEVIDAVKARLAKSDA